MSQRDVEGLIRTNELFKAVSRSNEPLDWKDVKRLVAESIRRHGVEIATDDVFEDDDTPSDMESIKEDSDEDIDEENTGVATATNTVGAMAAANSIAAFPSGTGTSDRPIITATAAPPSGSATAEHPSGTATATPTSGTGTAHCPSGTATAAPTSGSDCASGTATAAPTSGVIIPVEPLQLLLPVKQLLPVMMGMTQIKKTDGLKHLVMIFMNAC